jgi:hypothetical protein
MRWPPQPTEPPFAQLIPILKAFRLKDGILCSGLFGLLATCKIDFFLSCGACAAVNTRRGVSAM